jgi:hypothetical protein
VAGRLHVPRVAAVAAVSTTRAKVALSVRNTSSAARCASGSSSPKRSARIGTRSPGVP